MFDSILVALFRLVELSAGRIEIDFKLRPLSDVWESGQYKSVFLPGSKTIVTFYGPDVDTSRSGSFEGQQGKRGTLDTSGAANRKQGRSKYGAKRGQKKK